MKIFLLLLILPLHTFAKGFVPDSFSANYEESVVSLVTGKEKKSFGKIDYKFPGSLRFEVTSPVPTLFVVNPKKSWLFQPAHVKGEKDQVTIQKASNLPLIKFLDSVKDGIEKSKLFTTKYGKNDITLTFVKTIQKEMGFIEVVLHSEKAAKEITTLKGLNKITLKNINGSQTNIKLLDLKENVSFSPKHFIFTPSPNTKIITD
jgi:outer membrane lipoprotein carrier protein